MASAAGPDAAGHMRTSMDGAARTPYAGLNEDGAGAMPLRAMAADSGGAGAATMGAPPPSTLPISVGARNRQALSFIDPNAKPGLSTNAETSRRSMNQTVAARPGSRVASFARPSSFVGVGAGAADRQINMRRTELLDVTSSLAELTVASRSTFGSLPRREARARIPSAAIIPPAQGHADGTVTVYDVEVATGAETSHIVAAPQLRAFLQAEERGRNATGGPSAAEPGAAVHSHVRWIAVASESLPFIPEAQHCDAGTVLRILRHRYDLHPLALRGARRALYGDGVGHMYGHASFLDDDHTQCGLTFSYLESTLGSDPTQAPDANAASCKALFVLVLPAQDTIISFAKDHGAGNRLLSSRTLPKSASLTGDYAVPAVHSHDNGFDPSSTGSGRFSTPALSMTTISPMSARADSTTASRPEWHTNVLHALAGHAVLDLPDVESALQGPRAGQGSSNGRGKDQGQGKVEKGRSASPAQETTLQRLRPWCVAYVMLEQGIDRFRPLLAYYAEFLTLFDAASTSVIKPSLVADMQAVQKGLAVFEIFVSTIHDTTTNLNEMVQHHEHYHITEHSRSTKTSNAVAGGVCDELGRHAAPFFEDAHQQVSQLARLVSVYQVSLEGSLNAWSHWHDAMQTQVNTLLALVATVFLPLSFFTGVFGMNFQDTKLKIASMPLLNYEYGYEMFWVLAFIFAALCVYFFRRHQWFELASISLRGQYMAVIGIIVLPTVIEILIYYTQESTDV